MSTVDTSKIKIGDQVTIRATVVGPSKAHDRGRLCVQFDGDRYTYETSCDHIATHHPAPPKPLEVGDRVKRAAKHLGCLPGVIRAVDGVHALVLWSGEVAPYYAAENLGSLERIP